MTDVYKAGFENSLFIQLLKRAKGDHQHFNNPAKPGVDGVGFIQHYAEFLSNKNSQSPDRGIRAGLASSSWRRPALQNPEQLRLCFSPL